MNNLDSFSFTMSLAGLTVGAMAGFAAYSLAAQKQAFRVNLIASMIIATIVEIVIHATSFYREFPELGRFTLGLRNFVIGFTVLDAYLGMTGLLATTFVGIQNNFASQAASLAGFLIVQFSSHVYSSLTS